MPWTANNLPDLRGQTIVVGFEAARGFAQHGARGVAAIAHVMTNRVAQSFAMAARSWEISEPLTGVAFGLPPAP